jgi:flagellin-like protein
MKILRSRKALSPVIATIILIAVTVAVSIAVAAWMGALTFSFMGTEQLALNKIKWTGNTGFTIYVNNTGTKDVTITQIMVNYVAQTVSTPTLPYVLKNTKFAAFTVTFASVNGTSYDISVVTSDGYKFTNSFRGGQNIG